MTARQAAHHVPDHPQTFEVPDTQKQGTVAFADAFARELRRLGVDGMARVSRLPSGNLAVSISRQFSENRAIDWVGNDKTPSQCGRVSVKW